MNLINGQTVRSKNLKDKRLEIVAVDNLLEEWICIELYSHDAGNRYTVKFDDILEV